MAEDVLSQSPGGAAPGGAAAPKVRPTPISELAKLSDEEVIAPRRQYVAKLTAKLGPEHPETLKSRDSLAFALQTRRKYAEAEQEQRAVLAIRERLLGADHPEVLADCYTLAAHLLEARKLPDALAFAQRAENGFRKIRGSTDGSTQDCEELRKKCEAALAK